MFKIKIKPLYADILKEELKKEFGIDFTSIDAGDHIGLIEDRELTEWTRKQIGTSINMFKGGIRAAESKIDELRSIFKDALQRVHQL